jgi:transcriptional regulator
VDQYVGQLVVLRSRWNLQSTRLGLVISQENSSDSVVLVLWTDEKGEGVKLRYHLLDAVIPINEQTSKKIEERICDIK